MPIRKAVFPIAGLGTRFLPATKANPKEMLPVVDKPLIQYAVEEAYAAGIREMIFVTGRTKRAVEDHFDTAYELENELELAGKLELLEITRSIAPSDMTCTYVRQNRALGLGHAVLCAKHLIGDEAFAVILADDLMFSEKPVIGQLIEHFEKYKCSVLAVVQVDVSEAEKYGIVEGHAQTAGVLKIEHVIEKPPVGKTQSTTAIVGRYVLNFSIFEHLSALAQRQLDGEIQLTDAIQDAIAHETFHAVEFSGRRYDCGSKLGMLQATVDIAMAHPEVGRDFSRWLSNRKI
jgi:UTP--glucose-1-phosphate uridylyltransferase